MANSACKVGPNNKDRRGRRIWASQACRACAEQRPRVSRGRVTVHAEWSRTGDGDQKGSSWESTSEHLRHDHSLHRESNYFRPLAWFPPMFNSLVSYDIRRFAGLSGGFQRNSQLSSFSLISGFPQPARLPPLKVSWSLHRLSSFL